MMHSSVQSLTQAVATAIARQNGDELGAALQHDLGNTALLAQLSSGRPNLEQLCGSALEEPYDEMLLEHLLSLKAAHSGDHVEACTHLERACSAFLSAFEKDTAWSLPALHTLNLSLRRAAIRADAQLKQLGEKQNKLQEAATTLQKSFRIVVTDRAPIEVSTNRALAHEQRKPPHCTLPSRCARRRAKSGADCT